MTLYVYTQSERERQRERSVELVALFEVFGHPLELCWSRGDGYYLRGDGMRALFGTPRADVWLATHPVHATDDGDAVELARREVLTLSRRACDKLVSDLGERATHSDLLLPTDTEFEAYCGGVP